MREVERLLERQSLRGLNNFTVYLCFFLFLYCFPNKDNTLTLDNFENKNELNVLPISNKNISNNLVIEITAEDNFELSEINFKLSNVFPQRVFEYGLDRNFLIPIRMNTHHAVYTNINFSEKIIFRDRLKFEYSLPNGLYFASMDNGRLNLGSFKFSPMEFKKILFMFGYSYDDEKGDEYLQRKSKLDQLCYEVNKVDFLGKYNYSCPAIAIEENKRTIINIKIGKRIWNSNAHIFFYKVIPGIFVLGPVTNFGYYFHRDYEVEVITKNIKEND